MLPFFAVYLFFLGGRRFQPSRALLASWRGGRQHGRARIPAAPWDGWYAFRRPRRSGSGYGYLISGTKDNFTLSFHTDVNHFYAYACGAHPIADKTAFTAKAEDGFLVVAGTNGVMTVDGAMHAAINTSKPLGSGSNNIWLFNCPSDSAKRRCSGKISFVKLYDAAGRLVFDGIPCLDEYGEPGFYNAVGGTFHGNDGNLDADLATDLPTTAAAYEWTGEGERPDWSDPANWNRSGETAAAVPGWSSSVVFPSGAWTVNVDRKVGVRSLGLAADVALALTNETLRVRGDLAFDGFSDMAGQGLWFEVSASRLTVSGKLSAAGEAELPMHFVLPPGGYARAPMAGVGASFADGVRVRVCVEKRSPALKSCVSFSSPLLEWSAGVDADRVACERPPGGVRYVWRADGTALDVRFKKVFGFVIGVR